MIEKLPDPFLRLMIQDEVETALTIFWLSDNSQTADLKNIAKSLVAYGRNIYPYLPENLKDDIDLQNRAVVVKWLEMLNLKCRVLSYLGNSKLIEPLFLPTKKEDDGSEVEISADEAAQEHGWGPIEISTKAFCLVDKIAQQHDIVVAEAEMKFGYDNLGKLVLAGGILSYRDVSSHQILDHREVLHRLSGVYID